MNHFFIESLSPLYEAVQTGSIFPDSKFFPDCTPKSEPAAILEAYEQAKNEPGFDLKNFVETHFDFPPEHNPDYRSAEKPIMHHLENLWDTLLRHPPATHPQHSTAVPLPHPYVVPGGRFREVYYWDSYFTMLGLQVSGRANTIRHMVDNFAHQIETLGFIPNGNRSYYLGRSQPPFFALMVNLLAEMKGDAVLLEYRRALEREYTFWMRGESELSAGNPAHYRVARLPDGNVLNRYWDEHASPRPEAYMEDLHVAEQSGRAPDAMYRHIRAAAESGWDFSSRWFADGQRMETIQTTDLVPVDLNCLLYYTEKTLVHTYRLQPDHVPVEVMKDLARLRKTAIQKHCWNEAEGYYFDYHSRESRHSREWTLAGVFPLFFHIAETEQAKKVAEHLEKKFLHPGGLVTTLTRSGQQWDAPNGWAPLQWMAIKGLRDYGYTQLADEIRQRWMALNEKTYVATGKMMEKYNVMDIDAKAGGGEYPNQDGFGWTNGVYLKLKQG